MANPKITLSAGTSPIEGAAGTYLITLDTAAPVGGLRVNFNTVGSTATLNSDYAFAAGSNLTGLTATSFTIAAGAKTATLNLAAATDIVTDSNETVAVNLTAGTGYSLDLFAPYTDVTGVAVGANPYSITTGDFNKDGNADLATANVRGNTVSIRLGNGSGGFIAATDVAVGTNPYSITTGDFNSDGNTDLATANWKDNTVSIRLGNGSGGFTGITDDITVGAVPYSITTADFNGDGKVDLATANGGDNTIGTISVLSGNGNGDFTGITTIVVGPGPHSIITADFNGDGKADLATANVSSNTYGVNGNTVSIRLNNGSDGFTAAADLVVGDSPVSITTGNFNGDGNTDLATANGGNNTISVRLGNGSGGFTTAADLEVTPYSPRSITTGDFNGDGNMDLAAAAGYNISAWLGNGSGSGSGSGSFTAITDITLMSFFNLNSITTADFNHDGNADLAAVASGDGDKIFALNASGTLRAVLTIADAAPQPVNHVPTGDVTITGNTVKGQILTAHNNLADADGLGAISYQWQANNVNIGTGDSYTLTGNEIGKTITAIAQYTDLLGTTESVSSAATATVTDTPAIEPAGVSIIGSDFITSEQGDTAIFNVKLNAVPIRDVTIDFTSSDTTEGVITNPTLKFTSTNWSTTQTFMVTGQNDSSVDGDIAYSINAKLTTLDVIYKSVTADSLTLTNQDTPIAKVETINGTDNIDILSGTSAPSYILGKAGDDDLSGGAGNDTIYGSYGNDLLFGEDDNDKLYGEQDADYLDGGAGNDTLDGGLGLDTLIGGSGSDTYYLGYDEIDVIDDQGLATDVDIVIMPYQLSKYTLPKGIEQGTIAAGTGSSNLTGNTGDNTLTGNDGKNKLIGAVGRDSLFGGLGDDVLNGGTGNDVLEGGTGKDNLTGGAGKDSFLFDTALKANVDKITDFKPIDDTLTLENSIFTNIATGALNTDNFVAATTAIDSNDYLVYNKATGALFYDADGSGVGAAVQIAVLGVNLALTNADFVII